MDLLGRGRKKEGVRLVSAVSGPAVKKTRTTLQNHNQMDRFGTAARDFWQPRTTFENIKVVTWLEEP